MNLQLAYIILCGDIEEPFFSYGYNDEKSKVLYSAAKDRMPNATILTCFKKHFHEIMNERLHNEESSGLFFYLPSITECKEKINQFRENVNLNPIDFLPDKVGFKPHLLNYSVAKKRDLQVELLYNFFRQMAETTNATLIQNADYLLASDKQDNSKIVWVGPSKQRYNSMKFKLTYQIVHFSESIQQDANCIVYLCNQLWFQIFIYLRLIDIIKLSLVSRRVNEIVF